MPDYPSNISRAQFALIQPDLENFRKHTRPRRYDLYDGFNAILYHLLRYPEKQNTKRN